MTVHFTRCAAIASGFLWLSVHLDGVQSPPERPKQQSGDVVFAAVSDLSYPLTGAVVIGARPADPKDFKASFYSQSSEGSCTSALVGPRALLTAAHCVANGGHITLSRGRNEWKGTCEHAPGYATDVTSDWALCVLSADVPGVPYERVNLNPALPAERARLLLTGFGCTQAGGCGGNDGIYRVGDAVVVTVPSAASNDIITKAVGGTTAALCFGDSGGPAFIYTDRQKRVRVQVGVNSRANIKDTSYLSSTSTPSARSFFTDWSSRTGVGICGVDPNATGCRPER